MAGQSFRNKNKDGRVCFLVGLSMLFVAVLIVLVSTNVAGHECPLLNGGSKLTLDSICSGDEDCVASWVAELRGHIELSEAKGRWYQIYSNGRGKEYIDISNYGGAGTYSVLYGDCDGGSVTRNNIIAIPTLSTSVPGGHVDYCSFDPSNKHLTCPGFCIFKTYRFG